ncbi:MAG: hypothetical protein OXU73_01310 [Candidatus Campbellbacteria bacterium]|nr:hypothetical protein [Candidatus Campbellbacteria bacterium]
MIFRFFLGKTKEVELCIQNGLMEEFLGIVALAKRQTVSQMRKSCLPFADIVAQLG